LMPPCAQPAAPPAGGLPVEVPLGAAAGAAPDGPAAGAAGGGAAEGGPEARNNWVWIIGWADYRAWPLSSTESWPFSATEPCDCLRCEGLVAALEDGLAGAA